jgi:hypothetical protein
MGLHGMLQGQLYLFVYRNAWSSFVTYIAISISNDEYYENLQAG